jgi:signal transduction histidine kinase
MTGVRSAWAILAGCAALWALAAGAPFWLGAGALTCAVLPSLIGTFVRNSVPDSQAMEIESVLWVALATLATASTGGAGSPLSALFAAALGQAWATGRRRLLAETAIFALAGYVLAALASGGESWIGEEHAAALGRAFGLAALAWLGVLALAHVRPAAIAAAPVNAAGNGDTARRLAEAEARATRAEAAARAARAEAEAAAGRLEARTRFFAQTSHELRTPLNAITGFAEMMKTGVYGPLPERYADYAALIHEGGRNLSIVVDDVLDLAHIEAGYKIAPDLISLTDLAAEAVRFMADAAARKSIALELETDDDVEAFADTRAVRQIALNLISNALKFTPEGGRVTVATLASPGGALLAVSDTGVGIDEAELQKLSRAFEQGVEGRKQKGTGLGLSVVRAFAELHGGRLDIESRKGGGSTIGVFFPNEA